MAVRITGLLNFLCCFTAVGPAFTTLPINQTIVDPNSAVFNCVAEGLPRPVLTWTVMQDSMMMEISSNPTDFDIVIVEAGDRQVTSSLTVNSVRPALAATYTCLVSNVVRNNTASASLVVHSKFKMTKQRTSIIII